MDVRKEGDLNKVEGLARGRTKAWSLDGMKGHEGVYGTK